MHSLLNFNFLVILNLFIVILWPASGWYNGVRGSVPRYDVLGVILLILTVIAVILDIFYMVLALH